MPTRRRRRCGPRSARPIAGVRSSAPTTSSTGSRRRRSSRGSATSPSSCSRSRRCPAPGAAAGAPPDRWSRPRSSARSWSWRRRCWPPPRTSGSSTRPSSGTRSGTSSASSTSPWPRAGRPPADAARPPALGEYQRRRGPLACPGWSSDPDTEVVRVALERESIEKRDFPIGRRGYDPDAVDAHLSFLAEQVDELKRASRRRSETLATSASEQVRSIVEAAETSAAEIQRQAEEDAREIRGEASAEAQSTREQATEQAREYVGRVSESTAVMLQRLDAMESELSALVESLRTGSNRLNADLQLLEGNLGELTDAAATRSRFEPEEPAASRAPASPAVAAAPEASVVVDEVDLYEEQGVVEVEPEISHVESDEPVAAAA